MGLMVFSNERLREHEGHRGVEMSDELRETITHLYLSESLCISVQQISQLTCFCFSLSTSLYACGLCPSRVRRLLEQQLNASS